MAHLEMRGITKEFPGGVVANAGVELSVERGEIHALVGENGAGKSTLMNILYGIEQPDAGEIHLDDQRVTIPNPQVAIRLGIGMVHQHFQLIPSMTVAENVTLGHEPGRGGLVDRRQTIERVASLSDTFGLKVDPAARVGDLSVGIQQRVEILKLLYRDARLLILDEPSAVLTPQEVDDLFIVLRRLVGEGRTAIFITHKLYEVMNVCQRATVLRRGQVVGRVEIASTSPAEIALLMVGHEVESVRPSTLSRPGPVRLTARNVEANDDRDLPALRAVSFSVHAGEILGVAGVEGNGQRELVEVLMGGRSLRRGELILEDQTINTLNARQRRERGLATIPEDRNRQGLSRPMRIWENMIANGYYRTPVSRLSVIQTGRVRETARQLISRFDIRTHSENVFVSTLSGGNAQKVIIARELEHQPRVLIAAQPTRGLDIGAAWFVYEQLLALRQADVAVLLISADLDELLTLSDRIAVLFGGRILHVFERANATRERLGLYMAGRTEEASA